MPGTARCAGTIAAMLPFFAGVVAGISGVGLLVIVLAPSRRVRAETRLDREVETRLLLGVDLAAPLDERDRRRRRTSTRFPGAAELQALRQLDSEQPASAPKQRSPPDASDDVGTASIADVETNAVPDRQRAGSVQLRWRTTGEAQTRPRRRRSRRPAPSHPAR